MRLALGAVSLSLACLAGAVYAADLHAPEKEPAQPTPKGVKTDAPGAKTAVTAPEPKKDEAISKKSALPAKSPPEPKKGVSDLSKNAESEKSASVKKDVKLGSGVTIVHIKAKSKPAPMLVPPPPPDTPTMMPSFNDESGGLMPMEYMSPELLQKRKQDLVAQLSDAKTDLKQKQSDIDSVREKAVQFKTLFEEGVISRRELEAAQKDAGEIDSSVNRAQLRVSELQTLLDGVNGRWNQISKNANKKKITQSGVVKRLSAKPHRTH